MSVCVNQVYKLKLAWRRFLAGRKGAELGQSVRLGPHVDFNLGGGYRNTLRPAGSKGRIRIGDQGWIEKGAVLWAFDGSIRTGTNVFLGPYVTIYGHGGVEIGDQTLISMHATILSSNHAVPGREKVIRAQPDILLPTKIGRDVWIGANAVILGGVTIGDGCVIGAGSVVTKDLPAYSVAFGAPARVVRSRG
jgi:acetyltransferase-like isoleucine patch superfamily enzyme